MPLVELEPDSFTTQECCEAQRDADWEVYQALVTKTYCAYCGAEFDLGDADAATTAVTEHIYSCEKHPMRELEAAALHALQLTRPRMEREQLLNLLYGLLSEHPAWCYDLEGLADAIMAKQEVSDAN